MFVPRCEIIEMKVILLKVILSWLELLMLHYKVTYKKISVRL